MKDILISLLLLLVIIVIRGSYDNNKDEIDRVPYYHLTFNSMERKINPDEEIFFRTDL